VPENDSHGEYIYAVAEYFRFTHDTEFLRRHWPRVRLAAAYIRSLTDQRSTDEFRTGPDAKRVFYGLVPESISHEGYSAKPMHSYWDDFFTLKGLKDAAFIAETLGEPERGPLADQAASFERRLLDSIQLAMRNHRIDYLPGCAELGDFDATSTTVALWPCGAAGLPALNATFDRYMAYFRERQAGVGEGGKSEAYTPYEWRTVGALVRLGRRDDAAEVAGFLMNDRRPAAWNQWAEVVWKDPRAARFIGDMPHTWVGSDFINSFRSMFAYDREPDGAMVLCAGLPFEWFRAREGLEVRNLRTSSGPLTITIKTTGRTTTVSIDALTTPPRGGLILHPPEPRLVSGLRINGQPVAGGAAAIPIRTLPAVVELDYP
jgi:hypothetical protein